MRSDTVRITPSDRVTLQIARWIVDFIENGEPDKAVIDKEMLFLADGTWCALSALAAGCNAPQVLRRKALRMPAIGGRSSDSIFSTGLPVYGAIGTYHAPYAIAAEIAARREWDSNGTNFGYDSVHGNIAGEFGHNDFDLVPWFAGQMLGGIDGARFVRALIALNTVRGRLAEVFSLNRCKVDHVLYGASASAGVASAIWQRPVEEVAMSLGAPFLHAVPFRAIRAGKQLSDSKGASAALSTMAAIEFALLAADGFKFPTDVYENPEAIFRLFGGPGQLFARIDREDPVSEHATDALVPFEIELPMGGSNFPSMGFHLKMGWYEHQTAGAVAAIIELLQENPWLLEDRSGAGIEHIEVGLYEKAYVIVGKPEKRSPKTRMSADHSILYILACVIEHALNAGRADWVTCMPRAEDFCKKAIGSASRTRWMSEERMSVIHDSALDAEYPKGIPARIKIRCSDEKPVEKTIIFPLGHALNQGPECLKVLDAKHRHMQGMTNVTSDLSSWIAQIPTMTSGDLSCLFVPFERLEIEERDFDA